VEVTVHSFLTLTSSGMLKDGQWYSLIPLSTAEHGPQQQTSAFFCVHIQTLLYNQQHYLP